MYAIKNEHGDFYTGKDYIFQSEKYAIFTRLSDEECKKYRTLKVAEKVKKRLELRCNGFNHLEIVQIEDTSTAKKPLYIRNENLEYYGGNPLYGTFITGVCPNCGLDVQLGMNFCSNCGQKLLWGDKENEQY